jgi:hypothetical protein
VSALFRKHNTTLLTLALAEVFNKNELEGLVLELSRQVAPFVITHTTKGETAHELVSYCKAVGKLNKLVAVAARQQPAFGHLYSELLAGTSEPISASTPRLAEYLLWYLPIENRDEIIGDLEEEYQLLNQRHGRRKARVWYYSQVVFSFWPFAERKVRSLAKWGAIGWVADVIRQIIP